MWYGEGEAEGRGPCSRVRCRARFLCLLGCGLWWGRVSWGEEVCGEGGGLVLDVHGGLVGEEIGGLGLGSVVDVEGLRLRGRWGG